MPRKPRTAILTLTGGIFRERAAAGPRLYRQPASKTPSFAARSLGHFLTGPASRRGPLFATDKVCSQILSVDRLTPILLTANWLCSSRGNTDRHQLASSDSLPRGWGASLHSPTRFERDKAESGDPVSSKHNNKAWSNPRPFSLL